MNYQFAFSADVPLKQIGGKVRALRKRAGLTQKELARKAGCSPNTVVSVERGKRRFTELQILIDLAAVLDVDWTTFFDFTDEERKEWT